MTSFGIVPFGIAGPGRILFGRGEAARAPGLIAPLGLRGMVLHGANPARAEWLMDGLRDLGLGVTGFACAAEPTLSVLEAAVDEARASGAHWVVGLGGGAAMDLAKAVAGLVPQPLEAMDHLEVVGRGLPLTSNPLPFIAIPTTSGTGAEATKNAVIGLPDHGRKVSLRDDRMLARIAIVDPALTDGCPRAVTLASGLDAITQVIEPFISCKATPYTDALTRPAIARGLRALMRLMEADDPAARDDMAFVSLCGGMALANSGLGVVHGLAGVIGGTTGAAHGAICGALLAPSLAMNMDRAPGQRMSDIARILGEVLGSDPTGACDALARWAQEAGLPGLRAQGLSADAFHTTALASQESSSMKGNPVPLSVEDLCTVLAAASR